MMCDCGLYDIHPEGATKVLHMGGLDSVHRAGRRCYDEITPGADGLFRWRPTHSGGTGDATEPAGKIAAPRSR